MALGSLRVILGEGSTCGDTGALETRLAKRGIAPAPAEDPAALTVAEITARTTDGGAEGTFVLAGPSGISRRSLTAPSCEDLLDALAFAMALALESPDEPTPPPPRALATPPERDAPRSSDARPPLRWGGAASMGIGIGTSPAAALVVSATARVESGVVSGLSPAGRIGIAFTLPSEAAGQGAELAFAAQAGLLDLCPLRLGSRALGFRPCARVQVGRLQARSQGLSGARLENRVWGSAGLVLEASLELGLGTYVALEASAAAPLRRDEFFIGATSFFTVPVIVASGSLGFGVHFP
jgi:hypothetical protein